MDSSGSEYRPVAVRCEHDNEPSSSVKGKELLQCWNECWFRRMPQLYTVYHKPLLCAVGVCPTFPPLPARSPAGEQAHKRETFGKPAPHPSTGVRKDGII